MTIPPDGVLQAEQELTKWGWQRLPRLARRRLAGAQLRLMAAPEVDQAGNQTGRAVGPASLEWDLHKPAYMPTAQGIVRLFDVTSWRSVMDRTGLVFRNATTDRKGILERFERKVTEVGAEIDRQVAADRKVRAEEAKILKLPDPGLTIVSTRKEIVGIVSAREFADGETGRPVTEVTYRVREYNLVG